MGVEVQQQRVITPSVVEFSSALEPLGWHADFRQLKQGAEDVQARMVQGNSTSLMQVDFKAEVHQIAIPPSGFTTFGIPIGPQAPGKFGRRVLESETLTCFDTKQGLDVVSPSGFSAYTVAINTSRLAAASVCLEDLAGSAFDGMQGLQVRPQRQHLQRIRYTLGNLFDIMDAASTPRRTREIVLQEIETDLPLMLLDSWQASDKTPYIPQSARTRALRKALEYIHDTAGQIKAVEDLCRVASCSLSTMERVFREHFGIPPKRYLIASRLSAVRQRLMSDTEERTIADIAADFGFWHMGKFAADYRKLFGELPSASRPRRAFANR